MNVCFGFHGSKLEIKKVGQGQSKSGLNSESHKKNVLTIICFSLKKERRPLRQGQEP